MNIAEEIKKLEKLDINNVASWPMLLKGIVVLAIAIAVLIGGWFLDTTTQIDTLESAQNKETKLKKEFEEKQAKAARLDAYKKQMDDMQRIFGEMLRQLPGKTEVAALLIDISQVGLASGLEFELFKPEPETPIEFYAELPIKIKVVGNYHEFGNFVSGVAALPRIVTLHDFVITTQKQQGEGNLIMEATAKTYRYLDDEEIQQETAKKKASKAPKKK